MKIDKLLFFAAMLVLTWTSYAQQSQIVIFVYSNSNHPTNALRSQLTQSFLEGKKNSYNVVDRTDEILDLLVQEYKYQRSGMVRDDQLVDIGEHLGANFICAVAVTHYSQYNQYFFEGKIIDVETRQIIRNSLYPNDSKSVVNSMDPQTQMRVGKELAEQLDLYSSAQLAERQKEKEWEAYEKSQAEKDAIELRVGDVYESYRSFYGELRIGYLDYTKKHGLAYVVDRNRWRSPHEPLERELKIPTCTQLKLLYGNKSILGLYGEYWSCEMAHEEVNGWGDWSVNWYYTIDFSNGEKHRRSVRKERDVLYVYVF